jgi:hypothetical protein
MQHQKRSYFDALLSFVSDRCVSERKVSDVPSFGQRFPWRMRPLDDASLADGSLNIGKL